jgi:hypothetical protein
MSEAARAPFHLAIPVDHIDGARAFYGGVLGLPEGRSAEHWVDWNLHGHQLVTHVAPGSGTVGHSDVDGHRVPVPHFGLVLPVDEFHAVAPRLREAGRGALPTLRRRRGLSIDLRAPRPGRHDGYCPSPWSTPPSGTLSPPWARSARASS